MGSWNEAISGGTGSAPEASPAGPTAPAVNVEDHLPNAHGGYLWRCILDESCGFTDRYAQVAQAHSGRTGHMVVLRGSRDVDVDRARYRSDEGARANGIPPAPAKSLPLTIFLFLESAMQADRLAPRWSEAVRRASAAGLGAAPSGTETAGGLGITRRWLAIYEQLTDLRARGFTKEQLATLTTNLLEIEIEAKP